MLGAASRVAVFAAAGGAARRGGWAPAVRRARRWRSSSSSSASSASSAAAAAEVLDLAPLLRPEAEARAGRRELVERARAACRGRGYFHARAEAFVPPAELERCYGLARRFHALPEPVKARSHFGLGGLNRGWVPLFSEPVYEGEDAGKASHVEAFDLARELPRDHPAVAAGEPGIGPNTWPAEAELPGFRSAVYQVYERFDALSAALFALFEDVVDLPRGAFSRHSTEETRSTMRLLRYPPNEAPGLEEWNTGIASHTDFECFTVLWQDQPGLQVRDRGGEWVEAGHHGDFGVFTVIIGDMTEYWTGGELKATPHRVRHTKHERISIVRFNGVDNATVAAPMPRFATAEAVAKYPPISQADHLRRSGEKAEKNLAELIARGIVPEPRYGGGSNLGMV